MSVSNNYERVQLNARFPAMLLLQDLTGNARTIQLHWHRSIEIDLITSGELVVTIAGRARTVMAPGLILVNSGELHELQPRSARIQAITLLISYDFIKTALPNFDQLWFNLRDNSALVAELSHTLRQLADWYRQRPTGYQLLIGGQLYQILYLLTTQALVPRNRPAQSQRDYRIKATLTTLHAHYREPQTLGSFATRYHLSRTYFSHLFRQETGMAFRDYLLNLRVEMAQRQLSMTDLKVIDIALDNGFGSAQRFIKAFEKIYGLSPNQYRQSLHAANR